MKNYLALFNTTPNAVNPIIQDGHFVHNVDIQNDFPFDINDFNSVETCFDLFPMGIDGIIGFPVCTHFAGSGAQYWPQKDKDGRTAEALELVDQMLRMVDLFKPTDPDAAEEIPFFWVLEQPVGRLAKLRPQLGKPWTFDPCDYAGYLNPSEDVLQELDRIRSKDGDGVTRDECLFALKWNAYKKRTCLFGDFNRDIPKKPIQPIKGSKHGSPLMKFGGSSEETKNIRSASPEGFFRAFWQANKNHFSTVDEFVNY